MKIENPDSFIVPEFRGLARRFRERVTVLSDVATPKLKAIVAVAGTDCRRGYTGMRIPVALASVEAKWRALAGIDRLALTIHKAPGTLEIIDTRLVKSVITTIPNVPGAVAEPGLTIAVEGIEIKTNRPRTCRWYTQPIVTVSAHAIARFYERTNADDDALLSGLLEVSRAYPRLIETPGPFSLDVALGSWRGLVANLLEPDEKLTLSLHLRTFMA